MRKTGRAIMAALEANLARVGVPARVVGDPMVFDAVFTDQPVVDYRGTLCGDVDRLQRFNMALRARGVLKNGNKFYIALAHDATDIADTREAIEFAADFLADVPDRGGG